MQKNNPVKTFLILTITAFLLGNGLKTFLNSQFLNNYISNKLLVVSSRTTKFSYNKFKLYVSKNHLLPSLILQVDDAVFLIPDKCRSLLTVKAATIFSPVNIFKALWYRKNIQLDLEVDKLTLEKSARACAEETTEKVIVKKESKIENSGSVKKIDSGGEDLTQVLQRSLEKIPELTRVAENISQKVQQIKVKDIEFRDLTLVGSNKHNFNLKDIHLNFQGSSFDLRSKASWPFYQVLGKELYFPLVKAKLNKGNLKMRLLAQLKEGHISVDAEAGRSGKIVVDTKLKQLPLSEFAMFVNKVLDKKFRVRPVLSWVSCHLRINSKIENLLNDRHQISNCQIVGELGEWTISPYQFTLTSLNLQTEPLFLSVKKARLEKVIRMLGLPKKKSIFNKYGLFTGDVKLTPYDSKWDLKGEIKNLELHFSSQGQTANQLIKSLQINAFGQRDSFNVALSDFIFDRGEFQGEIKYHYSAIDKIGQLNAQFEKLSFQNKLQELYFKGVVPFFSGSVSGVFKNKQISLKSSLKTNKFESDFASVEEAEINMRLANKSLEGEINIGKARFLPGLYKNKKLNIDKIVTEETLLDSVVDKLKLKFEYSKNSLIWKAGTENKKTGGEDLRFTSFGTIYYGKNIFSKINFYNPKSQILWQWEGTPSVYSLTLDSSFDDVIRDPEMESSPLAQDLVSKASQYQERGRPSLPDRIIRRAREILPLKGQ